MKIWIASAAALMLVSACGVSKEATAALEAMNLTTGESSELVKYETKSGSGDKVTLKNVTLGPAGQGALKAAEMTLGGLDVSEGGKPVVTSLALKDITIGDLPAGAAFNLKTVTVDGLNPVTGEFLAATFKGGDAGEPPPFEQMGFGKVSVNGMTFAFDGASLGQPGKVNVQLGEFSISNLKDQLFGGAHLSGLKGDFDVPAEATGGVPIKGTFDFGTSDVKNIRGDVYAKMFDAGMASMMGGGSMQGSMMASMSSPLEAGYDEFTWSGMNIDASGAKLAVSKMEQKLTRNAEGVVTKISMPQTKVTFTTDAAGGALGQQAGMMIAAFGYPSKSIEIYGGGDATFDPATDTTRYVDYSFGLTDALDIKVNGGFQGLTMAMSALYTALETMGGPMSGGDPFADPSDPQSLPPAPDMSGLNALKLVDLDLTVTDKSLVTFLMGLGANPMFGGTGDVETIRTDVVNQVTALMGDIPNVDKAVSSEFSTAIAAFLKQPGTLNLKFKPAQPLAFAGDAAGPAQTKQSLGFSATFTPSPAAPKPAQ